MANKEHLEILKQGVEVWNKWREKNPDFIPEFNETYFGMENFSWANLRHANFSGTIFRQTNLWKANLSGADFSWATLDRTVFQNTVVNNTIFNNVGLDETILAGVDLIHAVGLETVRHWGPSTIGIDTIYKSKGNIPEVFLRGAGVPETMITFARSLVEAEEPIQFYACFISYSSKDSEFTEKLHAGLQNKGVRVWFAPEDLKIGDKLMPAIDKAIRIRDKMMIVLSEDSIESNWVEREVETAESEELETGKTILFPIRIDDAVMETDKGWAKRIRQTRHIGDFTKWKDHDSYKKAFDRLLKDLKEEN